MQPCLPDNRQATVHKIQVETGLSDGQQTEIISGISDTDQVVVSWTAQLYEGAQVQVLPGRTDHDDRLK